jgi:hypothetical protein
MAADLLQICARPCAPCLQAGCTALLPWEQRELCARSPTCPMVWGLLFEGIAQACAQRRAREGVAAGEERQKWPRKAPGVPHNPFSS